MTQMKRRSFLKATAAAAAVTLTGPGTAIARAGGPVPSEIAAAEDCCAPATSDWPRPFGNLGSQGYSALTQINKDNVTTLAPAWVTHINVEPVTSPVPGPGNNATGQQTTPIVVDGVMYLDTPGGGVIALHAATGAVKWKYHPSVAANGFGGVNQHRGVSVGEGKVYTTAAGNRVVALDQETGQIVWAVQPTPPDAAERGPLGNIAKVGTVYHDGLVYQGTNDGSRGSLFALRASDGALVWHFRSTYPPGTEFTDVNGNTFEAGDSFGDLVDGLYLNAGATPWIAPSIDPELGMLYQTFGNVRSGTGAQWGNERPGDNLFGSSLVALDLKTGQYLWHFQSIRHDIWDLDNVHTPTLADVEIDGELKKVVYYGSKSGHQFVLDRTNGQPALQIEYREVPTDARQAQPSTQPFPESGPYMEQCLVYQNLGSDVPGLPHRAVPNWNGYQAEPDPDNPGQLRLVLNPNNYLSHDEPFLSGPPRVGCMYDPHWDADSMFLSMSSQNGANDWSNVSFSPQLNLRYIPYSYNPVAHGVFQGGNGLRQIGGYQTGGLVAVDASTNLPVWREEFGLEGDVAHGNGPLVTASDLLFINKIDGWLLGMDAATGEELWRFQTGFHCASGVISYEVDGEQYIAMPAMAGTQPYAQAAGGGQGAAVYAFKLGGTAIYHTGTRDNPNYVSGSQEAPNPPEVVNIRRPVGNTSGAGVPPNTIYLARSNGTAGAVKDSTATGSMVPSRLSVSVGTTVTFTNPGDDTFGVPGSGNLLEHGATQFFEGLFNFRLQPGESAQYTFDKEGEYYYNDHTDPRPVGKVIVSAIPEEAPSEVQFTPNTLNMRAGNGGFTSVKGPVIAMLEIPHGYTFDGNVELTAPLTTRKFAAEKAEVIAGGKRLKITFEKGLIDNNIPAGDMVPLTVSANFMHEGLQKKLTSTTHVRVLK